MADPIGTASLLNGNLGNILNFLSAAAGLGTAAMGLVDATKAFRGGPSNFGFGFIKEGLKPFLSGGDNDKALITLQADWRNGVPKAEQKAKAKSLIRLGLARGRATALANAAEVDAKIMESLAAKIAAGNDDLAKHELNVLGQFDAVLSAALDAAYEQADQRYRNASKALATAVSIVLAGLGGWLIYGSGTATVWGYFLSWEFCLSLIVGASAAPLAPIAKDVATSLQAAATAVRTVRR